MVLETADLTASGMGPLAPPFLLATSRGFSAALEQGGGAPSSSAVYRGGDVRVCPFSGPARPAIAESAAAPLGSWRPTWPPWTWIGFMGARPPYSPEHPTGGLLRSKVHNRRRPPSSSPGLYHIHLVIFRGLH